MFKKLITIAIVAASLTGCASSQSKQPPLSRKGDVVAQGTGPLSFRSPERGMVSVYDVTINTVVHSSGLQPGDVLATNPPAGIITVSEPGRAGTQTVYSGMNKSHQYEIWFIPARGGQMTYTTAPVAGQPAR
jgi:hypothetical protein